MSNPTEGSLSKRLQKELMSIVRNPPAGVKVEQDTLDLASKCLPCNFQTRIFLTENLPTWNKIARKMHGNYLVWGLKLTDLTDGGQIHLGLEFGPNYEPFESPNVIFVCHPSVCSHPYKKMKGRKMKGQAYKKEHICLSTLAEDWSPALTIISHSQHFISPVLAKKKIKTVSKNPAKSRWGYHDCPVCRSGN